MSPPVTKLPPGAARNQQLTTQKFYRNPDVNHFNANHDECRGDAADKWLRDNDPSYHHRPEKPFVPTPPLKETSTMARRPGIAKLAVQHDALLTITALEGQVGHSVTLHLAKSMIKQIASTSTTNFRLRVGFHDNAFQVALPDTKLVNSEVIVFTDQAGTGMRKGNLLNAEVMFALAPLREIGPIGVIISKQNPTTLRIELPDDAYAVNTQPLMEDKQTTTERVRRHNQKHREALQASARYSTPEQPAPLVAQPDRYEEKVATPIRNVVNALEGKATNPAPMATSIPIFEGDAPATISPDLEQQLLPTAPAADRGSEKLKQDLAGDVMNTIPPGLTLNRPPRLDRPITTDTPVGVDEKGTQQFFQVHPETPASTTAMPINDFSGWQTPALSVDYPIPPSQAPSDPMQSTQPNIPGLPPQSRQIDLHALTGKDYATQLEEIKAAIALINGLMDEHGLDQRVELGVENNRIVVDAAVVIRQRL